MTQNENIIWSILFHSSYVYHLTRWECDIEFDAIRNSFIIFKRLSLVYLTPTYFHILFLLTFLSFGWFYFFVYFHVSFTFYVSFASSFIIFKLGFFSRNPSSYAFDYFLHHFITFIFSHHCRCQYQYLCQFLIVLRSFGLNIFINRWM